MDIFGKYPGVYYDRIFSEEEMSEVISRFGLRNWLDITALS